MNRVHDSSFQTNEIPSSDIQPKLINFEKREIRSKSQRKKRVGDEVKSSKKDTCPSVPPRSAFVHTKSVKEIQNEKFYVLPVQYSLLSTESTFSTVQHGVIVLPSAVSLAELTTRIQEQFDLPNDFDIILSQRNIDEIHRKNDNHATPAMLQVTHLKYLSNICQMFPRVCQTLRLSSPSLPTPFITDTTVIHITPCADKIKSTENIFTPPINSKSSAILDLQKLPVDGVDSSYRKKLLQTPKCGTLKPEPNAMKFSEVPITIKPDIGENISQREFNVDGILVESIEPNLSRESSRTHSPAQRKGIFNYTEIDAVKSDEESISLTIDGTVETENIEIEEEEEKDHLTQPQHELIDVFHHPDYLVTQLFNERKSQKFHPTEFPSKPLLEIDTQLHETVKRPIRNGIYSFHPPIDSFRKISEAQTPLSLPPSPSSSQLLTPIISDSPRHDEPKDQQNSFHDNFQWNENPSEPSELLNDTSPRLRTTPTTTKSFQFRQYYENFVKERKARELSSQLI